MIRIFKQLPLSLSGAFHNWLGFSSKMVLDDKAPAELGLCGWYLNVVAVASKGTKDAEHQK